MTVILRCPPLAGLEGSPFPRAREVAASRVRLVTSLALAVMPGLDLGIHVGHPTLAIASARTTIPEELLHPVLASYSKEDAERLRNFVPSDEEFAALKQAIHEALLVFEPIPGACVLLTAALQFRLEGLTNAPSYIVAGNLAVGDKLVFGTSDATMNAATFSQINLSWDGHCWLQFGKYIVDISLCRTALSNESPPLLAAHLRPKLGGKSKAILATYQAMTEDGLVYMPLRVLTRAEIDPLVNGALKVLGLSQQT